MGADQAVKVVIPDTDVEHPPLLAFLHGRGGDESEYWQDHWDEYMRFYSRSPADCEGV